MIKVFLGSLFIFIIVSFRAFMTHGNLSITFGVIEDYITIILVTVIMYFILEELIRKFKITFKETSLGVSLQITIPIISIMLASNVSLNLISIVPFFICFIALIALPFVLIINLTKNIFKD